MTEPWEQDAEAWKRGTDYGLSGDEWKHGTIYESERARETRTIGEAFVKALRDAITAMEEFGRALRRFEEVARPLLAEHDEQRDPSREAG